MVNPLSQALLSALLLIGLSLSQCGMVTARRHTTTTTSKIVTTTSAAPVAPSGTFSFLAGNFSASVPSGCFAPGTSQQVIITKSQLGQCIQLGNTFTSAVGVSVSPDLTTGEFCVFYANADCSNDDLVTEQNLDNPQNGRCRDVGGGQYSAVLLSDDCPTGSAG